MTRVLGILPRAAALVCILLAGTGAFYEWGGPAGRGARDLKAKRYAAALEALRAGRADLPASAARRYDEALAFMGQGQIDSSYAAYRDAVRLEGDEGRAAAAYNLGNEAVRAKRFSEAMKLYRESLRVKPGDENVKRNLEEAIRMARGEPKPPAQAPRGAGGGPSGSDREQGQGKDGDRGESGTPPGASSPPRGPSGKGGAEFTPQEAERWLDALESQRRASAQQGRAQRTEKAGDRDW